MVQLIKKGGLRERANRSRKYAHSENNIKTLDPHRYQITELHQLAEARAEIVQAQLDKTDSDDTACED